MENIMNQDKKYVFAMVGTFDCENMGDLLFPIIFEHYFTKYNLLEKLYLFSPKECQMPFYTHKHVLAISSMNEFLQKNSVDAIIIGGGDLIRLDNNIGKSYKNIGDSSSLWAIPVLLGKQFGIPVIFNCPGVPFEFGNHNGTFVKTILEQVDYLSVRDIYSKELLEKCNIENTINVTVDSVVGIKEVYPVAVLHETYRQLIEKNLIPQNKYIVLQINHSNFNPEQYLNLKYLVESISQNTCYEICFMPIGYEHNDNVALEKLSQLCDCKVYLPNVKLCPQEMIAIISNSSFFIGTSLHGAVISYAYGVKFMEVLNGFSTKIYGFCRWIGADEHIVNVCDDLWQRFSTLEKESTPLVSQSITLNKLEIHWATVIKQIENGKDKKKQPAFEDVINLYIDYNEQIFRPKLYLDYGDGYSEDNTLYGDILAENKFFRYRFELEKSCKNVRFDPIEGYRCILLADYFVSNIGALEIANTNGITFANALIFDSTDPKIEFSVSADTKWVEFSLYVFCIVNLSFEWDKIIHEFKKVLNYYSCLRDSNDSLHTQLLVSQNELSKTEAQLLEKDSRLTSFCEKITELEYDLNSLKSAQKDQLARKKIIEDEHNNTVNELNNQIQALHHEIWLLRNSSCWKITKPIRSVVIIGRKLFSPKAWGKMLKKIYLTLPLSINFKLKMKSTLFKILKPFIKNTEPYKAWVAYNSRLVEVEQSEGTANSQISLNEKSDFLSQIMNIPYIGIGNKYIEKTDNTSDLYSGNVKYLAFYLPQYHSFPENDNWWGKGFTEWTNVTKAVPQFVGHNQPRLAGELGYYNLKLKETIAQQMELARKYGVYGFCIYYYWFDGKKLMDTPLNIILENKDLDFPFCLCWANENWSRKWDGKNQDILIAQNYDEMFPLKFIKDIAFYMQDSRYIRIDNKPVLVIYNANEIPDLKKTILIWRDYCREIGIGEIHLLAVDFALNAQSKRAGFDRFVEFPPHSVYFYGMEPINNELSIVNPNYEGRVFDYQQIVNEKQYLKRNTENYYKGIFLEWDNTARRPQNGTVYHRFSIQAFKEWLNDITQFTIEKYPEKERFLFINAWNEWAEGTYLEPDRKYGYAALETVKQVLAENSTSTRKIIYVSHDACYNGAQLLSLHIIQVLKQIFHYDVYVILIGGGVLENQFRELSPNLICLEREKNQIPALLKWLESINCQKALCNTVVSGNILKILSDNNVHCISMIHEMENVIREYHCEQKLENIAIYAEKIVFASDYVRRSAEKICPIPADKVIIAPQGCYKVNSYGSHNSAVRAEIRQYFNLKETSKIALGVGFGDQRKGVDLFVKCAIEVCSQNEDAVFIWVGEIEPECYASIKKILEHSDAENRIIFVGPTDDVFKYYSASDLYVLTSREDPFPTVVLEAMEASLPVVAFEEGGGYVENITPSTGILVPMEDWKAMAMAVQKVISDDIYREKMGIAAHELASQKFCFVDYVYKLLNLLGEHFKKLSVVIPNYNYSRYLDKRILSILQQNYPIYEIILLDDNSQDNSLDIMQRYVEKFPLQIKLYANEVNSGNVFNQWEKGCNLSKGDYIWIAEADDLAKPNFSKCLMEVMEVDPNVIMGYTQSYMIDEDGKVTAPNYFCYTDDVDNKIWHTDYVSDAQEEITKRLASKNTIPNVSAVIFKKQDFRIMFEEAKKYRVAGDWAFYVKLLEQGGKLAFVAESLNYHRRHSNSVTTELKAKDHFDEICAMQDYVCEKYKGMVDLNMIYTYRKNVKKTLGIKD